MDTSSAFDAEMGIMEMFPNRMCIPSILPTLRSLYGMFGGARPRISRAEIRMYYAEFFGDLHVDIDRYLYNLYIYIYIYILYLGCGCFHGVFFCEKRAQ